MENSSWILREMLWRVFPESCEKFSQNCGFSLQNPVKNFHNTLLKVYKKCCGEFFQKPACAELFLNTFESLFYNLVKKSSGTQWRILSKFSWGSSWELPESFLMDFYLDPHWSHPSQTSITSEKKNSQDILQELSLGFIQSFLQQNMS